MSRTLWHQSGVNSKGEPFVQLFLDEEPISQFTVEEARNFALVFLESAEAAEQDAFMRDFILKRVGGTEVVAAGLIQDFRKWREARGKKGPPSDPQEFVRTDKHSEPK
jgi:hypothetical protein